MSIGKKVQDAEQIGTEIVDGKELPVLKPEVYVKIYCNNCGNEVDSEEEAKAFDIEGNPGHYPIFLFETDTSGEKTYEEFYTEEEEYDITKYDSLGFIKASEQKISFNEVIKDFDQLFDNPKTTKADIVLVIKKYVPDFEHIETGKHLDQKM